MAGSINKVILVGNLGQDPRVSNPQSGAKVVSFLSAWRRQIHGVTRSAASARTVRNGTASSFSAPGWPIRRKDICVKVPRFIWKVRCRPVSGTTKTDRNVIRRKLCCKTSTAHWLCLTAAAATVLRPVRAIFTTLRRLRDGTIRLLPELT